MKNILFAAMLMAAPSAYAQSVTAAPSASANAAPRLALQPIEPVNALEHAFIAALDNPDMRPIFRRQLLESHVALALTSAAADAPPLEFDLREGVSAALIFTSSERLDQVLGPAAPRVIMTGRAALERLRGKNVIVNLRLMPMLTLQSDDIARYLEAPIGPGSAGPSQ